MVRASAESFCSGSKCHNLNLPIQPSTKSDIFLKIPFVDYLAKYWSSMIGMVNHNSKTGYTSIRFCHESHPDGASFDHNEPRIHSGKSGRSALVTFK